MLRVRRLGRTRNSRNLCVHFLLLGNAFLFAVRDVVRAGPFKNLFCTLHFIAVFRVHGNQNVALLNLEHLLS
jgi:hypothetical protein